MITTQDNMHILKLSFVFFNMPLESQGAMEKENFGRGECNPCDVCK